MASCHNFTSCPPQPCVKYLQTQRRSVYLEEIVRSAGMERAGSSLSYHSRATRSGSTAREFTTLKLELALLRSQIFSGPAGWSDQKLEQFPVRRFGHHRMRS